MTQEAHCVYGWSIWIIGIKKAVPHEGSHVLRGAANSTSLNSNPMVSNLLTRNDAMNHRTLTSFMKGKVALLLALLVIAKRLNNVTIGRFI